MEGWIITGVSRGIGRALLDALLARPSARVVGVARQPPQDVAADRAGRFDFIAADLAQASGTAGVIERALEHLQGAASLTLINNAGVVAPIAQAGHYPADEVACALAINLQAPMLLANDFLRSAPAGIARAILNISSGAAVSVYPGWGVYGASKAGLDHFTRHLAAEQTSRPNPVRVCALYPGVVDTAMQANIRASDEADFPNRQRFDALKRDGALTAPDLLAARILHYLDSAAFGTEPVVDIRTLTQN